MPSAVGQSNHNNWVYTKWPSACKCPTFYVEDRFVPFAIVVVCTCEGLFSFCSLSAPFLLYRPYFCFKKETRNFICSRGGKIRPIDGRCIQVEYSHLWTPSELRSRSRVLHATFVGDKYAIYAGITRPLHRSVTLGLLIHALQTILDVAQWNMISTVLDGTEPLMSTMLL